MEIQHFQKEHSKNIDESQLIIAKNLRQIKTAFYQLHRESNTSRMHLMIELIDNHSKEVSKYLSISEKKVLKAYLDFHLQDIKSELNQSQNISFIRRKRSNTFSLIQSTDIKSPYQNRLLQIFTNWFKCNIRMTRGFHNKSQFLSEKLSQGQQILSYLSSLVAEQSKNQKKIAENTMGQNYCQITLTLMLIAQINLSIFFLNKRQPTSVNFLISKSKATYELLKTQNSRKDTQILKNLRTISDLHQQKQKQIKQYLLNKRVNSLKRIQNTKSKETPLNRYDQNEQDEEKQINKKYSKIIEAINQENKKVLQEKLKVSNLLQNLKNRVLRIENAIFFQSNNDFSHKLKQLNCELRLFSNQKLNKALNQQKSAKEHFKQDFSSLIFSQQSTSERSIYLSVTRGRKSMQISVKDYFNLCLLLKKNNKNKQAIVYFEILVFNFKKKQFLSQYCMKENLELASGNIQASQDQTHVQRVKQNIKKLHQFIKSQELTKMLLFSLVNLVDLYEKENANYWAIQSLNYLSETVELRVLDNLLRIKQNFSVSNFSSLDQKNSQTNQTNQQKECQKLIQKYTAFLEEIKLRLIKASFNSFQLNQKDKTIVNKPSQQYFNLPNSQRKTLRKSPRQTAPLSLTLNMRKLNEKESELLSLIRSGRETPNPLNKMYQTSVQSPMHQKRTILNKVSNTLLIKQNAKRYKKDMKGSTYQAKKRQVDVYNVLLKEALKSPVIQLQNEQAKLQQQQPKSKKLLRARTVKFTYPHSNHNFSSTTSIVTSKSIGSQIRLLSGKKNTLKFLQTSKTIQLGNKTTRLCEYRKKLLQSKEQLQEYIRLSFLKLNSCIKNPCVSTISLDDVKMDNIDVTLQMNQVLSDFNQLLVSLKTLRSFTQESFQRQTLIDAKIKVYFTVKSKTGHDQLIEVLLSLLEDINLLRNSEKRIYIKKKLLWQVAENYYAIKQFKKCISTYTQLGRLGEVLGYLKIAEIYMMNKDYDNSIKFHEKYANERHFDLQAKVKLAHAYSKVPQYYMKTVDMLMGMLIAPGTSAKFKQEIYQRVYDDRLVESAVILLASMNFKNENFQKAIELCQNYCKVNIKNYRVLHLLGGFYKCKGNDKKAFQCYLNALENNPTHHKSLIELTEFICAGSEYKTHAIRLLRKCFCMENRNFEILTTLIRFLKQGQTTPQDPQKSQLTYINLLQYAEILKNTQTSGYSGSNFYEESSLVYEWALHLLQKNACIANLDEIEHIYRNLGEICLKKGDYSKSQNYSKIYLIEIEKYVNRSNLNEHLREQKIDKTKIQVYHFLGKIKKQQKTYKKAIDYFTRSFQFQKKYQTRLRNLDSYFYWFEVGYCYFQLEDYQTAIRKFSQHKNYLLHFIKQYDVEFFQEERKTSWEIASYLELHQGNDSVRKKNFLKQIKIDQNQTSQNTHKQEQNKEQLQHFFKKNYFENQLHLAFCYDKLKRFIESKEIYKKILQFLREVENTLVEREKQRKAGKKIILSQREQARQSYLKTIMDTTNNLNEEYKLMKKVCLINLANIYRIEGIGNKYRELVQECRHLFPENFSSVVSGKSSMSEIKYTFKDDGVSLARVRSGVLMVGKFEEFSCESRRMNVSLEDLGKLSEKSLNLSQ